MNRDDLRGLIAARLRVQLVERLELAGVAWPVELIFSEHELTAVMSMPDDITIRAKWPGEPSWWRKSAHDQVIAHLGDTLAQLAEHLPVKQVSCERYHEPISLSSRHQRTLGAVFQEPSLANIVWADVEAMLIHIGAHVEERKGSAIAIELSGQVLIAHRPHPQKEAKRYLVRKVREFLLQAGIAPK